MTIDQLLVVAAALWGAAAGTLVPRAAYRFSVPPEEPWRDSCPQGHPLGGRLGLARCATCAGTGSGRERKEARRLVTGAAGPSYDGSGGSDGVTNASYGPSTPLLALATALVCAALAAATGTRPELGAWLLLAPVGVLLAVVDFRVQRLPDPLTLPLAAAALVLLGGAALLPEHAGDWLVSLLGALALGGAYFVLFLISPGGMGFGDVKLALGLGAILGWYGWGSVVLGTFAGFLFGGLYGLALVVARRAGRKTSIPFGPFLIAGAFVGVLIGAYAA
ncbi:prepilin peptidase [Streptomyces sp. WI04-05B]|uniref:prepilin peptidase n=1 Tax=Streptomyces TaxID=1883 RepID=UPI0029BD6C24|nr:MULTISPECIES: A24 family peptidase [unclassified Streptomyces]MDX2542574.1 A24 family peptidase [Streptomyces sp. WI04-05B]MDX2582407.1 A24 family peptidase [Streptomyces sp. WI04-05A]